MAEMVLLKCDAGSRSAIVLCPECGRISRQALSQPYLSRKESEFLRVHICPVCSSSYRVCSPSQAKTWVAALSRYEQSGNLYNGSVRETYERRSSSVNTLKQEVPTKSPADEMTYPIPVPEKNNVSTPLVDVSHAESFRIPDENLDRKIERWKRELLDTGKRNKMINYRETKRSTLQILEPGASELFNRLAFSEKPLSFQKPISKDSDLRLYSVIALMETLSYSLNVQQGDIKTSGTIIEREKTLKNLRAKAKLAQEEQGANILYLCFGFIYWRENNRDNSPWCKAPLLMMPVTLGLKSLNAPYTLCRDDDEIEVNPTLDYLFNTEYNIDLPTFELKNRDSFDDYLAQIEELVDKRGWKVVPEVSLGLLSFLKISMYHDLNNNRDRMQDSPVLRAMAGDRAAIGDLPTEAENFDFDKVDPKTWYEVVDSDSSQEEAILLSKLGVSFVMQGPPGTGKSQTITNIIAEGLADGKKILFVSEKAAALQVVLKRLTEVHLDDFCLSLHNYKANKKEIVDSIGANLSLSKGYIDSSVYNDLTELFHDRQFLDEYAEQLHQIIHPLDQSVYMVFGKLSKLGSATKINFMLDEIAGITKDKYASFLYCVLAFEKALRNLGGALTANPWHNTKATTSGQNYKNQLEAETKGLSRELRAIASLADDINRNVGIGAVNTLSGAEKLLIVTRILLNKPEYVNLKWLNEEKQRSTQVLLEDARSHAGTLHHYQQLISGSWHDGVYAIGADKIRENFCGDYSWIYNTAACTPIEHRLKEEKSAANILLQQLEGILAVYRDALGMLAFDQRDTIENIKMVSEVLSLAAEAPYMEASWFDMRKMKKVLPLVEEAQQHNRNITTQINAVLSQWESDSLEIDVDSFLSRFKTQYSEQFFKAHGDYVKDIKVLRLHSKKAVDSIDVQTIIGDLQRIKRIQSEAAWFYERKNTEIVLLVDEARRRSKAIADKIEVVLKDWEPTVFEIEADSMLSRFKTDYIGIFHKLKEQYKEDIKTLRLHSKAVGIKIDETMAVESLQRIKEIQSEAAWFGVDKSSNIVTVLMEAVQRSSTLSAMVQDVLQNWEPTILETEIDEMLSRFKTEYSGTFCQVNKAYDDDIKSLCLFLKPGNTEVTVSSAMSLFLKIKEIQEEKTWFDLNQDAFSATIGSRYRGAETDWDQVCEGIVAASAITSKFPYGNISEATIAALIRITESLQLSGTARKYVEGLSNAVLDQLAERISSCKFINRFTSKSLIGRNVITQIKAFMENCVIQGQYIVSFSSEKREGLLTYENITTLLDNLEKVRYEQEWFKNKDTAFRELFGELNQGADSPWEELNAGLVCAEQISRVFERNIPPTVVELLSGKELSCEGIDELERLIDSAGPKVEAFEAQFVDCDFKTIDMSQVANRYDACMDSFSDLNKWLDYVETRAECDKQGLSDFTSVIAAKDNSVIDVKDAFERCFYTHWLMRQLDTVPAVQTFRKRVHEQRGERFSILDTKQYEIARDRIRESIIKTYPSVDNVAKAGSELGILRHEMEKKRRIMPVRKLFQKIPNLLLTLKPCLMMSPLSVAYFLEANSYHFDMVIFDEASQIFPQDAIGAIFRAKQVVIAGDTRQLPPTNFFSASTSNNSDTYDDEELEEEEEVFDSILEETANILPNRTLLWHYRSKHEHLIAFSNQQIYKNELVTFPSSNESEPDTGVEFVYVEDGYYEGGGKNCNVLEAKRCVELVIEHIERHPERSLGIIAFGEKQQQAILLEIQRFRERNPKYEEFFQEGKEDEFFVKNLENVQGDERDTILFSIGYARTKDQKANGKPMAMRFGPLGVAGGERRLNVAITRAKINIKLVSSILPSDIDISRTESEGIRMLRSYIEFAMNGEASLAATHRNGVPDDFADMISKYIQEHGYKLKQYVGCSGYKIDIAIQHPSNTIEQFVAGIECDGFSYAAARTARDRDRLRSTILKNMGWNLYRVWSAEWYKNPEIEGKKLLAFIDNAIKACDEKVKRLEEEKREAEERRAEEAKAEEARRAKEAREEEQKRRREMEMRAAALERESVTTSRTRRIGETTKMDPRSKVQSMAASKGTPVAPDIAWAKVDAVVRHSVFGDGVIKSITGKYVIVTFGDSSEKKFLFPDAFANGLITRRGITAKREMSDNSLINSVKTASSVAEPTSAIGTGGKSKPAQRTIGLLDALRIGGFKYIDNRATSSILWVLYAPERQEDFEQIVSRYSIQWRLEKRGALATGNTPAWRIMFN